MTPAGLGTFLREGVPRLRKGSQPFTNYTRAQVQETLDALDCAVNLLEKAENTLTRLQDNLYPDDEGFLATLRLILGSQEEQK